MHNRKNFSLLCLCVFFLMCKHQDRQERTPLPAGGLANFTLLADDTRLLCPCAELIPIASRPAFPRVQGSRKGGVPLSEECLYQRGVDQNSGEVLTITIRKTTKKLDFDALQTQSDQVKMLVREKINLAASDHTSLGDKAAKTEEIPFFMAIVKNSQVSTLVSAAHVAEETLLVEVREPIDGDRVDLPDSPPAYYVGLVDRIISFCR